MVTEIPSSRGASRLLAQALREDVVSGRIQAGERLPTMRELMARYKLTYGVVNRAIGLLAAEGLVAQHGSAGTFVSSSASGMANPRPAEPKKGARCIGVVLPYWAFSTSGYTIKDILHGICQQANQSQCRVDIIPNTRDEAANFDFVDHIVSRDLDGVLWLQPWVPHEMNLARLLDCGVPVVATGRRFVRLPLRVIHEDLAKTGELIAEYMVRHGRQQLIVMAGPTTDAYSTDRITAIRAALEARGLSLPEENVCVAYTPDIDRNDDRTKNWELETIIARFLTDHPDFDTLFGLHPVPLASLVALHNSGKRRCPEDFVLIQMNQHYQPVKDWYPRLPLVTLEWPIEAIGRQAVKTLQAIWDKKEPVITEDLAPRLDETDVLPVRQE